MSRLSTIIRGDGKRLGVPRTRIERLVKCETRMTPDTALRLSKAFATTPAYWMNMQVNHDLVVVREIGLDISQKFGLDEVALNQTYLVVSDGIGFTKSDAGMIILSHLKSPWNWLRVLRFIPRPIRDLVYSTIAKRRYKWFGYEESCLIPTAEIKHRFVDV